MEVVSQTKVSPKSSSTGSIMNKKNRMSDNLLYFFIYLSAGFSVALLVGIIGYVFVKGISSVNLNFLTTVTSAITGNVGIAGNIVNTIYIVILTLLIATPIGIGSAIYLNEYAKPGKVVSMIEFTTETLSGIPSIIFGLFGMVFFGKTLKLGYSILTGALTLTLMILPLITRNTQEALKTVPESYRSGALGILAVGRIVGESAALLFTAGSGYLLPANFAGYFEKIFQSGGTLTIQLYLSMSKGQYGVAFGIGVVLLVIVFCINLLTKFLAKKLDVNHR